MRTLIRILTCAFTVMLIVQPALSQKIDDERMERDIAVAENVLGTLIKQQFNNQRTFFPLEIKGNYQAGYGVTFTLPADYTTPIAFTIQGGPDAVIFGNEPNINSNYSISINGDQRDGSLDELRNAPSKEKSLTLKDKANEKRQLDMDSIRDSYNLKVIEAAKTFLADYGDMITQLAAREKVVITNQGNQPRVWVNQYFSAPKRTHLSVEAVKSDLTQYREGKLTRPQVLSRIKVVNTETIDEVAPDLELLSSIFTRLYGPDLSKTYFVGDNVYFERLKDFGVIYYMQLFSGYERGDYSMHYVMPTLGLNDVDQVTKDKKVKELYPKFEQELKDNILEYGRTLKSLKDDESLVFQVTLTKCTGCGIPSTLEISLKASAIKDFNSGKADKSATLSKLTIKKGGVQ